MKPYEHSTPVEEITAPSIARVVIYARVSGANQRKELENQIEALKKYAEQNNWRLEVVRDIASGLKEDRRGLVETDRDGYEE